MSGMEILLSVCTVVGAVVLVLLAGGTVIALAFHAAFARSLNALEREHHQACAKRAEEVEVNEKKGGAS